MGANVLVELENVFLIGGIFFKMGDFFLSLGQKIILGSRKSAIVGNYMDPCFTPLLRSTTVLMMVMGM